jgi:lipopolysaccharide export system protein LptA
MHHFKWIFLLSGLLFQNKLFAQLQLPRPSQTQDTTTWAEIQNANKFFFKTIDTATQWQILSGNVKIKQGKTIFWADSVIYNEKTLQIEAFGNIHIRDSDTINIFSKYLLYEGSKKLAHFKDDVKLSDGNSTLFTSAMDYDLNGKVGTYMNGGRIESKETTLTSNRGFYYADIKDVYFIGDVKMSDPEMTLATDSLLYNTGSRVSTFIAPTTIKSKNSIIRTKQGFYDVKNRQAKFGGRTKIQDSSSVLYANDFAFNDATGLGEAKGDVRFIDSNQHILLYSNRMFLNKKQKSFLATEKPVMIIAQEKDSVYITADTIFSGKMNDLFQSRNAYISQFDSSKKMNAGASDSSVFNKKKYTDAQADSLRFITGFRNVRIFNDSLQAIGDSLFYCDVDSVFELYHKPVAWSKNSQILGDTIFIETHNKQPKTIRVFENASMIQEDDHRYDFYNQIKGRVINGYFKDGRIDFVEAKGSAESIYYIKNEDSAYVGMNRSEADRIEIYFDSVTVRKIKYTSTVKGITYPIRKIPDERKKFRNFQWLDDQRPKSKWEIFL